MPVAVTERERELLKRLKAIRARLNEASSPYHETAVSAAIDKIDEAVYRWELDSGERAP